MSDLKLASLSLTHVHYDPTDFISYVCAWLALLPQGLVLVYVVLVYTHREVEIGLTFAGQLACEALNWALKRYFKQARPEAIHRLGKGYGMPSSHAQFVSYFAVSVTLFLLFRHSPSARNVTASGYGRNNNAQAKTSISPAYRLQLHHPRLTHALLSLVTIVMAVCVAASRVYLQYHTNMQVLVGCGAGALFAGLWFSFTELVRRLGLIAWVLDLEIVRKARIRDLICEEDLVEIGWQVWEEKRKGRMALHSPHAKKFT